jgi:hypothetical protein
MVFGKICRSERRNRSGYAGSRLINSRGAPFLRLQKSRIVATGPQIPSSPEEMEFEIEFTRRGLMPYVDTYHLHPRCFAAWEFERGRVAKVV